MNKIKMQLLMVSCAMVGGSFVLAAETGTLPAKAEVSVSKANNDSREKASEKKIAFNFSSEELGKMIEIYSRASGQKFVVDAGVRGRASILMKEPVSLNEAFNQLSLVLSINGYAISKMNDTMVVRAARNIQRDLIEVSRELPALNPQRMVTWIYQPKFISAESVMRELRILSSKDGEISISPESNLLIMSDFTSNIHRVAKILEEIDKPVDANTAKILSQKPPAKCESAPKP